MVHFGAQDTFTRTLIWANPVYTQIYRIGPLIIPVDDDTPKYTPNWVQFGVISGSQSVGAPNRVRFGVQIHRNRSNPGSGVRIRGPAILPPKWTPFWGHNIDTYPYIPRM